MRLCPLFVFPLPLAHLPHLGAPPQAYRSGFKDTVHVEGKESGVLVCFDHPAPKEYAFMAHCHLLEPEDTGMMMSRERVGWLGGKVRKNR